MSARHAVALDLGATSARIALGRLDPDGGIGFEIVRQTPHAPIERDGWLTWDFDLFRALLRESAEVASRYGRATVGVDAWGVDHGFLDERGELIQPPVAYRDPSHARSFEALASFRSELYALTGVQRQPFNTLYQLHARAQEDPRLPDRAARWLPLPDLLVFLETGEANVDLTQASTSNLLGTDGRWSARAFEIAGWPVPDLAPTRPGHLGGYLAPGVRACYVGGHDTASAVAGLLPLAEDELFANVGTWSLVGCVVDDPVATPQAEAANLTNERCVDGRVRLLRNVPGFWVINRLHAELGVTRGIPEWLDAGRWERPERIALDSDDLFNPDSMVETCAALAGVRPGTEEGWAGLALLSLADALADQTRVFGEVLGRPFRRIKIGGGGSRSEALLRELRGRLAVEVGPAEATVLGNLRTQFETAG